MIQKQGESDNPTLEGTSRSLPGEVQNIEELKARFADLHERKIRNDQALKATRERLDLLRKRLREEYNTDSLEELEKMLEERKRENRRKRLAYQEHLDLIERGLSNLEERVGSKDSSGDEGAPEDER